MSKKIFKIIGLLLVVGLLVVALPIEQVIAADQCVNPGGTDGCLATIQAAIDAASPGDTVTIANGTYAGSLNIYKNLTLRGESEVGVIIDTSGLNDYGIDVDGDLTTYFSNFTLIGPAPSTYGYGLKVSGENALTTIQHVTVKNSGRSGIDLNGLNGVLVDDVTLIDNGGVGLALTDSSNLTVSNITTSGNAWGGMAIYVAGESYTGGSENITLTGTNSFAEPVKLYIEEENDFSVTNFTQSDFGFTVENEIDAPGSTGFFVTQAEAIAAALYSTNRVASVITNLTSDSYYVVPGMSIQAAHDAADPGDTIIVADGTYTVATEPVATVGLVNIYKQITIKAEEDGNSIRPVIDASGRDGVFKIHANALSGGQIVIEGFDLTGDKANTGTAITVMYCGGTPPTNIIIRDNLIHGMIAGINAWGSDYWCPVGTDYKIYGLEITENDFYELGYAGIEAGRGFGVAIQGLSDLTEAGGNAAIVSGNTFEDIHPGLPTDLGVGIAFMGGSANAEVIDNIFIDNIGIDIALQATDVTSTNIFDNDLSGGTYGVAEVSTTNGPADASPNWWGTAVESSITPRIMGNVTYDPWWVNAEMTILSSTLPTVVYVDDSYDYDTESCGAYICGYNAFETIQEGIDGVAVSGTVNVANGTYTATSLDSIVVAKDGVSLIGESRDGTIIDGASWGTSSAGWPRGIQVKANNITIKNFTIEGFTGDMVNTGGYGIVFRDWDHDQPTDPDGYIYYTGGLVENVKLQNNYSALYALVQSYMTVKDNLIQKNYSDGMFIARYSDYATITNNQVINSGDHGIWVGQCWSGLGPSGNATITGNTVDGAREGGISFYGSNTATINNNIVKNVEGCGWSAGAISLISSTNVTLSNNEIFNNSGTSCTSSDVGSLPGNGIGLAYSSSSITATNNKIYDNDGYDVENLTSSLFLATPNWWGQATGPEAGQISGDVDYIPWCTNAECTTFGAPVVNITQSTYFATIQEAINDTVTVDGDVIVVAAGTYPEQVNITKAITLRGPNYGIDPNTGTRVAEAVITGSPVGVTVQPEVGEVTFDGFTVQGYTDWGFHQIYTAAGTETPVHVLNNIFDPLANTYWYAVEVNSDESTVLNNLVKAGTAADASNSIGIITYDSSNLRIEDNVIGGTPLISGGIVVSDYKQEGVTGVTISENTINNTEEAIMLYGIEWEDPVGTWNHDGSIANVSIENNIITVANEAIQAFSLDSLSNLVVEYNQFNDVHTTWGTVVDINFTDLVTGLDLSPNWWDKITGPVPGTDWDHHYDIYVNALPVASTLYTPWCGNPECTILITPPVHNITQDRLYSTIQLAINAANSGDVIEVAAGTYMEQVNINKRVSIIGAGKDGDNPTIITSTASPTVLLGATGTESSPILLQDLQIQGKGGIRTTVSPIDHFTLDNVWLNASTLYSGEGFRLATGHQMTNLTITNSIIEGFIDGVIIEKTPGTGDTGTKLEDVTVTNTIFRNNRRKGLYIETLSNAIFTNVSLINNGFVQPETTLADAHSAGMDLNLKDGDYSNLQFINLTVTGNGLGTSQGAGLMIKARNDGTIYGEDPATLTGVTITGGTFTGNERGIRMGEPDKDNAGPTNVVISGASLYGNERTYTGDLATSAYGDVINYSLATVDATGNWWGDAAGPVVLDQIYGDVASCGWLNAAPPNGVAVAKPVINADSLEGFCTIQEAIDDPETLNGHTINVAAGTYVENVIVNKEIEVAGAGQASTIIIPAISNPTGGAGSIYPGSSNVILVEADNVYIHDLTIDGDNPDLTSDYDLGGANVDARNGIITNHALGTIDNLEVSYVTVKNIYLRGIYASSGGTFNIHHNTVTNVQGESASVGIMNWVGMGTIANNTVSYANDAISANYSSGTQFLNNIITNSGSGIHTDNASGALGATDVISGNSVDCTGVSGGYGIFTFVNYLPISVEDNIVNSCEIAYSAWGGGFGTTELVEFNDNTATAPSPNTGSVGIYITTDTIGYGYTDVNANFTDNTLTGFDYGIQITADQQSWNPEPYEEKTITSTILHNNIIGSTSMAVYQGTDGTYNVDLEENWWGSILGPQAPISDAVDVIQWCGTANPTCLPLMPVDNAITLTGTEVLGDANIYVPNLTINIADGATIANDGACFNINASYTTIQAESKLGAICKPASGSNGINVADDLLNIVILNLAFDGSDGGVDGIHFDGGISDIMIADNWFHDLTDDAIEFTEQPTLPDPVNGTPIISIQGNLFEENGGFGINAYTFTVPAEFNSWGHVDGADAGDGKTTGVDADPYTHVDLYVGASGVVSVGGDVTITIYGNLENVMGANFTLHYDPNSLDLDDTSLADLSDFVPGTLGMFTINETAGTITFDGTIEEGGTAISGEAIPIFSATFEVFTSGAVLSLDETTDSFFMLPATDPAPSTNIYALKLVGGELTDTCYIVTGTISMQGRSIKNGIPATLTGLTLYGPYTATTNNNLSNNLSFACVAPGTYTFTTNQPRYLNVAGGTYGVTKTIEITADKILPSLRLIAGNAVWSSSNPMANNRIGIDDSSKVGACYLSVFDQNYITCPLDQTYYDADVNFDGKVNILDLTIVGGNFYKTSATEYGSWTP